MKTIVCFGDSITAGGACHEGRRWTAVLQSRLDADFAGKFAVFNRGVGGNTSSQGLDRFEVDVVSLKPKYVLLEFGFNDASVPSPRKIARVSLRQFRENLVELVRLTREHCKAQPVLLVNHPIDQSRKAVQGNGRAYFENFQPYQPAIRSVARALRVPAIDLEKILRDVPLPQLVTEDGLHLSIGGNRIYGDSVYEALKPLLR